MLILAAAPAAVCPLLQTTATAATGADDSSPHTARHINAASPALRQSCAHLKQASQCNHRSQRMPQPPLDPQPHKKLLQKYKHNLVAIMYLIWLRLHSTAAPSVLLVSLGLLLPLTGFL